MQNFNKTNVTKEIEDLCTEYRKLDSFLNYPRSGNLMNFKAYEFEINSRYGIKATKYLRNATALEKFQSLIDKLDTYFLGIEYFNKKIILERTEGKTIPEKFKEYFFISVMADSLRGALDIYSKFIAWFYDLPEREEIGFNYKKLIKPLLRYSKKISQELNKIYQSTEYELIKNIRDSDKHFGKSQNQIKLESTLNKFNFEFKRAHQVSLKEFEKNSSLLFMQIKKLLSVTVDEFCKTKLGYDSMNDIEFIEDENGNLQKL